jgi:AcrR family transcriptional regulator
MARRATRKQGGDALPAPRERRMQQRSIETRERIEAAALDAFADIGFEGASTSEIARWAGVTQQLVGYHFGTKLALWEAVADKIFGEIGDRFAQRVIGLEGVDDATRLRLMVRDFINFSAEHPELARFMGHVGKTPGPRLDWLVEHHIRPAFSAIQAGFVNAQREGLVPDGDPIHLAYLMIGSIAIFSQAAEVEALTGVDPRAPEQVERYADLVERILLPGLVTKASESNSTAKAAAQPAKKAARKRGTRRK